MRFVPPLGNTCKSQFVKIEDLLLMFRGKTILATDLKWHLIPFFHIKLATMESNADVSQWPWALQQSCKHANEEINISALFLSSCQIRSSITTLLFSGREFSWTRHMLIAAAILAFNNMLVIFVPTIRDIFGFIGEWTAKRSKTWAAPSDGWWMDLPPRPSVSHLNTSLHSNEHIFLLFRLVRRHHAYLHSPRRLLPSPSQITAHELSTKDRGKFFSPVSKHLWFFLMVFF